MTISSVANGYYRIRTAGANSDIANQISNGKKCHYVQIGIELFDFTSLDEAKQFVNGKGLIADSRSLDFGEQPPEPDSEASGSEASGSEASGSEDSDSEDSDSEDSDSEDTDSEDTDKSAGESSV